MRQALMVAMIALAAAGACAGQDAKKADYNITAHLENSHIVDSLLLSRAKALASSMFAGIGINLQWKVGVPQGSHLLKEGCLSDADAEVLIHLVADASETSCPKARAYTLLDAQSMVQVTIFYDRVLDRLGNTSLNTALLAHILVHEITHAVQGVARHSEEGVMKARWSLEDQDQMRRAPLTFLPEDIQLIRRGLDRRSCKTQVAARASSQPGPAGPGQR